MFRDTNVRAVPQADGKLLLIQGSWVRNQLTERVAGRLNADGTLDTRFHADIAAYGRIQVVPAGEAIYLFADGRFVGDNVAFRILRLDAASGEVDKDFRAEMSGDLGPAAVAADGAGRLYVLAYRSDTSREAHLVRLLSDGRVDPRWQSKLPAGWGARSQLLITDKWAYIGGEQRLSLDDGQPDTKFQLPYGYKFIEADGVVYLYDGQGISIHSATTGERLRAIAETGVFDIAFLDGRLYAVYKDVGAGQTAATAAPAYLARYLAAEGCWDPAWHLLTIDGLQRDGINLSAAGQALLLRGRLNAVDGRPSSGLVRVDIGEDSPRAFPLTTAVEPSGVQAVAALPDGSFVAGGEFVSSNGQPAYHLAKFDAQGRPDTTWSIGTDGPVTQLQVSRSSLYAGGAFTRVVDGNGTHLRPGMVKIDLLTNRVDQAFQPELRPLKGGGPSVASLQVQEPWLYVSGNYTDSTGQHPCHLRLDAATGRVAADFTLSPKVAKGPFTFSYATDGCRTRFFGDGDDLYAAGAINGMSALARINPASGAVGLDFPFQLGGTGSPSVFATVFDGDTAIVGASYSYLAPLGWGIDILYSPPELSVVSLADGQKAKTRRFTDLASMSLWRVGNRLLARTAQTSGLDPHVALRQLGFGSLEFDPAWNYRFARSDGSQSAVAAVAAITSRRFVVAGDYDRVNGKPQPAGLALFEFPDDCEKAATQRRVVEYQQADGTRFHTAAPAEIGILDNRMLPHWRRSGVQFAAWSSAEAAVSEGFAGLPVIRYFDKRTLAHRYRLDMPASDELRNNSSWGSEGPQFAAVAAGEAGCPAGTRPVYRQINTVLLSPYWPSAERLSLDANPPPQYWRNLGTAFCVPAAPLAECYVPAR